VRYSISLLTLLFLLSPGYRFNTLAAQNVNKAMELYDAGKYKEAALEFEKAIPFYELQYGKKDTVNLTKVIYYSASANELASNPSKAKELYLKGINVYKSLPEGKRNPWYKTYLTTLSDLLYSQNELEETRILLCEIKENDLKYKGKKSIEYLESASNYAYYHFQTGNYSKARLLYTELKQVCETSLGKNTPEYPKICNNLAEICRETGQFQNAESLYKEAASIYTTLYGSNHMTNTVVSNNLAVYYDQVGDYDQAEQYYRRSNDIRKSILGTNDPDYALSCNNLAKHYLMLEMYPEAEPLLIEAKSIYEQNKAGNEFKYAAVCTNLAELYRIKGSYSKAEPLYLEALQISKSLRGTEHLDYASDCNNLGAFYRTAGKFDKAEEYYLEALKIREKKLGRFHQSYITTCNNLGELYRSSGDTSKAVSHYQLANNLLNHNILKTSSYMSENEREKYLDAAFNYHFDVYYSYFLKDLSNKKEYSELAYNNALIHKSQLMRSNVELRHLIYQSKDTSVQRIYNIMMENRNILAYEYLLPLENRRKDLPLIEERADNAEKELIDKTIGQKHSAKLTGYTATWDAVQSKLEPSQAAIEFIRFRYRNKNGFTDSVFYYALIVVKNFETSPIPVYLFEESELAELMKRKEGTDTYRHIKNLYDPRSQDAKILYKLIWQPLEPFLTNIRDIYLSPVGLLNTIAFDAIPVNENTLVSDKHKLVYLNVTSEITDRSKLYSKDLGKCTLFGGIEFSMEPIEMIEKSRALRNIGDPSDSLTSNLSEKKYLENLNQLERKETWSYLPGSMTESENISDILKVADIDVQFYNKKNATEEQFKAMSGDSPSLIHVSTHGFYFPVEDHLLKYQPENMKRFLQPDNPLFRSGFILAGGNNAFQGISIPTGIDDGVLTAYEISNLNLFNTRLVVLSACQTGLGEIKGFEGVYGMQRAFKNAGADYLLLSLWEVPDQQTQELMTFFYRKWCSGMEITDAFKAAQNEMKTTYAQVEGAAFAWAAFVLIK